MRAHRRIVLRRLAGPRHASEADASPSVAPVAAARLAEDVAAQVEQLRTAVNTAIDNAEAARDLGSPADTLRAVEEGRARLAEFDGSVRRLLVDASVEREAESILAAAAEGLAAEAPTSRAQRRRDLDDAIAIVHPTVDAPRRRMASFSDRAAALVAGAAALVVAVGLGSIVTSPPGAAGDLARSAREAVGTTEAPVVDLPSTQTPAGSGATRAAGGPTRSTTDAGATVDPYTLEIRWLLDPARGLLARLRDVTTVRSLVMREFEGIVAGLATERPASVEHIVAQAEAVARAAKAGPKSSDSTDAESADSTPPAGSEGDEAESEAAPSQPTPEDEGADDQGSDSDATDDDAPTATDHAPEPPSADDGDEDEGAAHSGDSGILGPPGGW